MAVAPPWNAHTFFSSSAGDGGIAANSLWSCRTINFIRFAIDYPSATGHHNTTKRTMIIISKNASHAQSARWAWPWRGMAYYYFARNKGWMSSDRNQNAKTLESIKIVNLSAPICVCTVHCARSRQLNRENCICASHRLPILSIRFLPATCIFHMYGMPIQSPVELNWKLNDKCRTERIILCGSDGRNAQRAHSNSNNNDDERNKMHNIVCKF